MTTAAPLPNSNFMQACWVVPDLRPAIETWSRTTGVGPFFWFDGVDCVNGRHRGVPAEFPTVTAAIAYAGDLQIELVSQDNDDPGVFRDLFGRGQSGLHHMALVCTDYESERDAYIAGGAELAFEGQVGNSRTCWVDTTPTLGFMIELLEPSPVREKGFAAMRAAAEAWDGVDPITRF
ncbi:glyoxalase [Mycolicibacterium chitae]|uniref:Glyoxalase n=1 Tax=Mycolicibacterium chitae TaxID=1792 RepID=A0A3S5EIR9_MYCCI|nr:VOC family protein [Mycolicibacterium chitae]MCV7107593.1 VOC family protein [Mycolicibacterium chitae]BBZ01609.1 glyoxalase [Mycolicibacterium chitae]VEG50445.1 glyoxalase [Mycolicibacterium chitae]